VEDGRALAKIHGQFAIRVLKGLDVAERDLQAEVTAEDDRGRLEEGVPLRDLVVETNATDGFGAQGV
jgi:hypothetical protein